MQRRIGCSEAESLGLAARSLPHLSGQAERIFYSLLIPPLMGFFAKQFVLYSAIQSGYYFMAIVGIVVSVISASYYLKIIRVLHSPSKDLAASINLAVINSKADTNVSFLNQTDNNYYNYTESNITNFHSFLISTLTLSILIFVLKPSILLNSTQLLSLSLFYY